MIKDRAVKRFSGGGEPLSAPAIVLGRLWVGASPGEHDPRAAVRGSIGNDPRNWQIVGRFIAPMAGKVEAARLLVDMRYPQAVGTRVAFCKASGKKIASGVQAVKLQRKFGTLVAHSSRTNGRAKSLLVEPHPNWTSILDKTFLLGAREAV